MKTKTLIYCLLAALFIIASCSRVPKHIISEKKMRALLYDMQLAEAFVETNYESYPTANDRNRLYNSVFAKHGITQEQYDSTLVWYGQNMDLYMRIYRLALRDINAGIDALGDIKPNPLSGEVSAKDSIDVWIYDRTFAFRPERAFNTLRFAIEPQMPYSSGSSYVLGVNIWGLSDEMTQKPRIHLGAVQSNTFISVDTTIATNGYHEIALRTVA
ncbi:MAG: DUF4296 domain-containing protein, partial [Tannerella sp.]|nr:DUF4296 domain-containing protein [Tannerella sp.]